MNSHLKLCALLIAALLIAIVFVAGAYFPTREQRTAKIEQPAPAAATSHVEATSPVVQTPSSPLQESLRVPSRREADKKPLFPSMAPAPRVRESSVRGLAPDADVAGADSEDDDKKGSPIFSSARDLRTRALKGSDKQETTPQSIAASDVPKVTNRRPVEMRLKRAGKNFTGDLRDLPFE